MKKSKKSSFSWLTLVFVLALILSTGIKIASVWGNNFAFTIDQGRDLVDVRHMVEMRSPRLVGPTTSINGVLLGPAYYYFISIPFILSGGSPAAIVYWQILWFQIGAIFLWWVIKEKDRDLADIVATLVLLSPVGFYTARYFWNANAMPIFSLLFLASLLKSIWSGNKYWYLLLGLVCGISMQIEAAFGIIFLPTVILVSYKYLKIKSNLIYLLLSFLATLLPQAMFELRHGFVMTKTLIAGLTGKSEILGEKLLLPERFAQRTQTYLASIREISHIPYEYLIWIVIVGSLYLFYLSFQKKLESTLFDFFSVNIAFLITSFLFYLIFSQNLKSWYTLGLPIFVISILSVILTQIYQLGTYFKIVSFLFILLSFYHVYLAHSQYLEKVRSNPSDDPSSLTNQIKAMDFIYQDANGKGFKVYNYLPSIYDYTYQHLFWWYGRKNYGYMPNDLAYLPNQPEYIEDMNFFHNPKREGAGTDPIYLIVEKAQVEDFYSKWLGNFSKYCQIKDYKIVPKLKVIKLSSCPEKTSINQK